MELDKGQCPYLVAGHMCHVKIPFELRDVLRANTSQTKTHHIIGTPMRFCGRLFGEHGPNLSMASGSLTVVLLIRKLGTGQVAYDSTLLWSAIRLVHVAHVPQARNTICVAQIIQLPTISQYESYVLQTSTTSSITKLSKDGQTQHSYRTPLSFKMSFIVYRISLRNHSYATIMFA